MALSMNEHDRYCEWLTDCAAGFSHFAVAEHVEEEPFILLFSICLLCR